MSTKSIPIGIKIADYFSINIIMSTVYLRPKNPVGNFKKLEFAYTPQIDYSTDVKYDTYNTTHTNYQLYGYTRTENPQINLNCKLSAHTTEHFQQSLYTIQFLRVYTKMNYGRGTDEENNSDKNRGIPPRILRFYAYGEPMFHDVPVVISKFNMTFPDDIDYVRGVFTPDQKLVGTEPRRRSATSSADAQNAAAVASQRVEVTSSRIANPWLPVFFQISISLLVQSNMYDTVKEFNLEKFAAGKLSNKGYI